MDQIVTSTSGHDAPHFGSNNNNDGKSRKKTKGKTSKYSIQTIKDTYSVKNTLDVWKQLQAHVASASANMQDGGGGTSTYPTFPSSSMTPTFFAVAFDY